MTSSVIKYPAVLLLVLILGLVIPVLPGSSIATVQAASAEIDLVLGDSGSNSWSIGNIMPGSTGTENVTLHNAGTLDGMVTIWLSDIVSSEGTNTESESGDTSEPGELLNYLLLNITNDRLITNLTLPTTINNYPQSAIGPNYIKIEPLRAGETVNLYWDWALPPQTGNDIQGDIVTFTINYLLEDIAPECVTIYGENVLQGYERPYAGHNVPLTLRLYSTDTVIDINNVLTEEPLYTYSTVDETLAIVYINRGTHTITWIGPCIPPGIYNATISSPHTLVNLRNNTEMLYEGTLIQMGTLLEGNASNDAIISGADLSMLLNDYLSMPGYPKWNGGRCDFDRNGIVDSIDFSLLAMNYNMYSPQIVR